MQSGQVTQVIVPPGPLVGQAGRMSNKGKVKRELKAKWTEMSKEIGESSRYATKRYATSWCQLNPFGMFNKFLNYLKLDFRYFNEYNVRVQQTADLWTEGRVN